MYIPFRFLNTPLGGGWAATQTFAPGGKYPRAATECKLGLLLISTFFPVLMREGPKEAKLS